MKRIVELVVDFKNKIYNTVFLKQMDTTVIKVKLLDNNIITDLTSQTVDIIFTKPNDTIVQQVSSSIDETNGIAIIPLLPDCIRQPGKAKMEIEVKDVNNEVISSFYIPVQIEKSSKENVTSDNTPNYFEEFEKKINIFEEESNQILQNIEIDEQNRKNEFDEMMEDLSVVAIINNYTIKTTEEIPENTDYEIPCNYKVGKDTLDIYYMGERLIKGEHYIEVGESGTVSNKIQFYNWGQAVPTGRIIEFVVRGVYENKT